MHINTIDEPLAPGLERSNPGVFIIYEK